MQATMAVDSSDYLGIDVLAQFINLPRKSAAFAGTIGEMDYGTALAHFEADYLGRLLQTSGGNIEEVAHQAGMNVATVYRKIKKYGLR